MKSQTQEKEQGRKDNRNHNSIIHEQYQGIKVHIFATGSTMNKIFLKSREKFIGYTATKCGNDVTFSPSKQQVVLMHTLPPTAIDHIRVLVYDQR